MMQGLTVATRGGVGTRMLAALSYLGVFCLIPLLASRDDEFVAFHAKQGVILWIWAILALLLVMVPGIGPFFFRISALLIPILSIIGLVSVLLNRAWMLPLVHDFTKRI